MKIYFVERCLYAARLKHLKKLAEKSPHFVLSKDIDDTVTHFIAQSSTREEVLEYLSKTKNCPSELLDKISQKGSFLDLSWFTECMKSNSLVEIEPRHLLTENKQTEEEPCTKKMRLEQKVVASYACQRKTPLIHPNNKFTTALEILEEHAILRADANSNTRALAFRRGSAVLKSLLHEIRSESDLLNLPFIDSSGTKPGHCKRVIMDILETGFSSEAEGVKESEYYKSTKSFCGIFGVGPQTAQKWYRDKYLRNIDDIRSCSDIKLNRDQQFGLEYYEDLNKPVPKAVACEIQKLIVKEANEIQPGTTVELVGGFRRGKSTGHDVDLLITHKDEGKEKNILPQLLTRLSERFIYTDKSQRQSQANELSNKNTSRTMDNFEKSFTIFKFQHDKNDKCKFLAVRVDLIVVPFCELPFAVLGWTGSKLFERELRRYAKTEKSITLTSHGMYLNNKSFPASNEREIFTQLGLDFVEPGDRNC